MSASPPRAALHARPSAAARIGRLVAIVLVFVALAPLIGALMWVALVAGIGLPTDFDVADPDRHWLTLLGLIYAVPISYYFGTAPAAAAGLVIGTTQAFVGRAGWPLALGTALVVAVAVLERSGQLPLLGAPDQSPFPEYPAIMILTCLVPTMLCWVLVRGWYFPPPPRGTAP
ncbi:MAG TPA: hypothetical protein VG145_15955 [Xanthobacteraceae bacterium]|jgi:hypothetical protein|nr:hypothetical protein [Xanthobacteraceae bacterium]